MLARGLDVPWGITFPPTGDALVAERGTRRIVRVRAHGDCRGIGRVPGVVSTRPLGCEGGLLGRPRASELGENEYAELNHIVWGGNHGWPFVQGIDGPGGGRGPVAQWHTDRCSPGGLAVLGGRARLGALQGKCLYLVRLTPRQRHHRFFAGRFGRLRMVTAAPDGSLWFGTSNRDSRATPAAADDRIFRVAL